VGNAEGTQGEEEVLQSPFDEFGRTPRGGIKLAPGGGIAFDPAFDPPEYMVKEDSVGTGPATPDAAQQGSNVKETEPDTADNKEQEPDILHEEGESEEVELPVGDVEQYGRVPIDRNPRQEDVDGNEENPNQTPGSGEAALYIGRVGEEPGPVRVDCGDGVKVRSFDGGGHGGD